MKIIKKVTTMGDSKGIILDTVVVRTLGLKPGDEVEIDIKKVKNERK